MTEYILVREVHSGRNSANDLIHCIPEDEEKTACGDLKIDEVYLVRAFKKDIRNMDLCPECKEEINDVL